ncbi:MAG: glycerophosphodiester phosphodiesterase [Betaproteobacteria bacterium]|nr:glycerophosphodiester phosphodiesterase [Betaproteobacteria bacterium]
MNGWPYPRLIAHRGGGSLAPENTLAALKLGASLGYRASEFDVKLSRDAVPFLLHDSKLERTTNGAGIAGEFDWSVLAGLDAGAWHSPAYRGEPLPRLDDVARFITGNGLVANVEIKPTPGFEAVTGRVVARACAELWAGIPVQPLLSSFAYEALVAARDEAPHLPRGWLIETPTETDFDCLEKLGAVSLHCSHRAVTPDLVSRVHEGGRRVMAWTVNDAERAECLLGWGVDGIFTDNLRELAARFRGYL